MTALLLGTFGAIFATILVTHGAVPVDLPGFLVEGTLAGGLSSQCRCTLLLRLVLEGLLGLADEVGELVGQAVGRVVGSV